MEWAPESHTGVTKFGLRFLDLTLRFRPVVQRKDRRGISLIVFQCGGLKSCSYVCLSISFLREAFQFVSQIEKKTLYANSGDLGVICIAPE